MNLKCFFDVEEEVRCGICRWCDGFLPVSSFFDGHGRMRTRWERGDRPRNQSPKPATHRLGGRQLVPIR